MEYINRSGKPPCSTGIRASMARTIPIGFPAKSLKPSDNPSILICDGNKSAFPSYGDTTLSYQQPGKNSPVGVGIEREGSFSEATFSQSFLPIKEGAHCIPIHAEFLSNLHCVLSGAVKRNHFFGSPLKNWRPDRRSQFNSIENKKTPYRTWIDPMNRCKGIERITIIIFLYNFIFNSLKSEHFRRDHGCYILPVFMLAYLRWMQKARIISGRLLDGRTHDDLPWVAQ